MILATFIPNYTAVLTQFSTFFSQLCFSQLFICVYTLQRLSLSFCLHSSTYISRNFLNICFSFIYYSCASVNFCCLQDFTCVLYIRLSSLYMKKVGEKKRLKSLYALRVHSQCALYAAVKFIFYEESRSHVKSWRRCTLPRCALYHKTALLVDPARRCL